MSAPVCSRCGNEHVEKVSAVVNAGTWSSTTGGTAYGVGRDKDGKWRPTSTNYTFHHAGATRLATLLAAPDRPTNFALFLGVLGFIAVHILLWFAVIGMLQPLAGETLGRLLGLLIVGLAFSWFAPPALRVARKQRKRFAEKVARWEQAMKRWNSLYYCARCDSVFDPERGKSAPTHAMETLL